MKNFKYTIGIALLISLCAVAFTFTPHRNEPVDIRSEGMGGSHSTDSESFYTLFSNPAGLAFADEKVLWPFLLAASGSTSVETLQLLWDLPIEALNIASLNFSHYDDVDDSALVTFMTGDFDFRVKQRLAGPLTFGAIKNNFGWGLLSSMYMDTDGTSMASSIWDVGVSYDFVVGYSIPIDLGFLGKLAFGFSGRGITQLQFFKNSDEKGAGDDLPMDLVLGFGFDIGIQYKMLNFINIAVVWKDIYSPVWVTEVRFDDTGLESGYDIYSNSLFEQSHLDQKISFGVGLDIPIEKITGNLISHFGIYADHKDLLLFFREHLNEHDMLLDFSIGAELVLFESLALRVGLNKMEPSAGLGFYLDNFKIDFSVFAEGIDTSAPLWGSGISMAVHY